jgi:hypothetical protein
VARAFQTSDRRDVLRRQLEIAAARQRVLSPDVRLLTLTGPAGTGKTRLVLAVGTSLLDEFADGVHFVDLAPIREPAFVESAIAQTLGVRDAGDQPLRETLLLYVQPRHLALVLDNFEQVVAAAPLVAEPRTTLRLVAHYADACNLGAASWAGGGFTVEDNRQKLAILDRHCMDVGRTPASVLRTCVAGVFFLAETGEAAQVKLRQLPAWVISGTEGLPGLERLVFAGTPEQAVAHLRQMVAAGFQYLICRVFESDAETLQLLASRVMPAVTEPRVPA